MEITNLQFMQIVESFVVTFRCSHLSVCLSVSVCLSLSLVHALILEAYFCDDPYYPGEDKYTDWRMG